MAEKYQTVARKSTRKFEVLGRKEVAMSVPLPLVEVWEDLQPEVEHLTGIAGLKIIQAVIEDEVTRRVGPRHHPEAASGYLRWGQQPGYVNFCGQKVHVRRPQVRTREGQEVEFGELCADARRRTAATRRAGRHRRRTEHEELSSCGAERSGRLRYREIQRQPGIRPRQCGAAEGTVRAETRGVGRGSDSDRRDLFWKAGVGGGLGIESSGKKQVLGVWQGATENTAVVKDLLEDLVARGLSTERRYLFVIDGAKALRAAIERVFGDRAEVQRCQLHKRRNVAEHLPKNVQRDYDRRIRNAYAMSGYAEAKAELEKIFRQLERVNPSAARSLEEGLEETLTVHRLDVGTLLRRSLSTTNPIESCLSTVERVARRVKRWHGGDQALRWTATGLLEAERKFHKVRGYREMATLQHKLNPSLTQQIQVA